MIVNSSSFYINTTIIAHRYYAKSYDTIRNVDACYLTINSSSKTESDSFPEKRVVW